MKNVEAPAYVPGHGLLGGRTAVITAAAGAGIGGATARRFLEEGARVLISDAHARRLKEHETELSREFPGAVTALPCDVTDEAQVRALFDAAVREHGRLDVVVNNAGLGGTSQLVDMTDEQWSKVLDVTLNGTFRCLRAALRLMKDTGGVIVNNASVAGWRAQAGQAMEAAGFGVRVNAVSPSLAMHPHLVKVTSADLLEELTEREAFGRYAEPWEVANVIVFLASGYSSYMTGEVVSVSSQHA
jgi:3-oxoacyl-[acyl-carrier protein] reductase